MTRRREAGLAFSEDEFEITEVVASFLFGGTTLRGRTSAPVIEDNERISNDHFGCDKILDGMHDRLWRHCRGLDRYLDGRPKCLDDDLQRAAPDRAVARNHRDCE